MTRGKGRAEDQCQTDLSDILARVMPERGCLAKTMISDQVVSEEERKDAIKDFALSCVWTDLLFIGLGKSQRRFFALSRAAVLLRTGIYSLRSIDCAEI